MLIMAKTMHSLVLALLIVQLTWKNASCKVELRGSARTLTDKEKAFSSSSSNATTTTTPQLVPSKVTNIVGGTLVKNEKQWMAHSKGGSLCGATLIHPEWLLTAAHCTNFGGGISLGANHMYRGHALTVAVEYPHPYFRSYSLEHDIKLIHLEQTMSQVQTIAWNTDPNVPAVDDIVRAFGYGYTSERGTPSSDLLSVDLPVRNSKECRKINRYFRGEFQLCIGGLPEGQKDSCNGDSGGPVVKDGVQVGIVSSGFGCARKGVPAFYTKISPYTDWINEIMCENSRVKPRFCSNPSTPAPTPRPTNKPTRRPTPRPTNKPTRRPTPRPTNKPTRRPTPRPTNKPTNKPTRRPTNKPTRRPTPRPSNKPTPRPSPRPTNKPTRRETPRSTDKPTLRPTRRSTPQPTNKPVAPPTSSPVRPEQVGAPDVVTVDEASSPMGLLGIPDISGAFSIEVEVVFDKKASKDASPRILDFGNGPRSDNIVVGQLKSSNNMMMEIYHKGRFLRLVAENSIDYDVPMKWKVGVDVNGLVFMEKDGVLVASQTDGLLPLDVYRENKLLLQSNWKSDVPFLKGALRYLQISDANGPVKTWSNEMHSNIGGGRRSLAISFKALMFRPDPRQLLFDFTTMTGNKYTAGPCPDNPTRDLCFQAVKNGQVYQLVGTGALESHDQLAEYTCGINHRTKSLYMEKNGQLIAEVNVDIVMSREDTSSMLIAPSPFYGIVLDLKVHHYI